jgi:hypothetical protein
MEKLPSGHPDRRRYCKIHLDWRGALAEGRGTEIEIEQAKKEMSPLMFTVMYDSEFPDMAEDSIHSRHDIEKAEKLTFDLGKDFVELKDVKDKKDYTYMMGCDIADLGLDETVFLMGWRKGKGQYHVNSYFNVKGLDTTLVRRKIEFFVAEALKQVPKVEVNIDGQGLGTGVVRDIQHHISEQKLSDRVKVRDCRGGGKAVNSEIYMNLKAENHFRLKALFKEDAVRIPNLPKLKTQLMAMKWDNKSLTGKTKVVDPEDSPDWADALIYFIWRDSSEVAWVLG